PPGVPTEGAVDFILVESIEGSLAAVEEAGGRVLLPKTEIPSTGWYALFEDTEGTTLAIWERVAGRDWPYWRQDLLRVAREDGR
ncbi:MAG: hypothetical protein R3291_03400, partial [Thermoplasmata archaeon]|nr:hypothetical protein [Thermoplasmata archaeon]